MFSFRLEIHVFLYFWLRVHDFHMLLLSMSSNWCLLFSNFLYCFSKITSVFSLMFNECLLFLCDCHGFPGFVWFFIVSKWFVQWFFCFQRFYMIFTRKRSTVCRFVFHVHARLEFWKVGQRRLRYCCTEQNKKDRQHGRVNFYFHARLERGFKKRLRAIQCSPVTIRKPLVFFVFVVDRLGFSWFFKRFS